MERFWYVLRTGNVQFMWFNWRFYEEKTMKSMRNKEEMSYVVSCLPHWQYVTLWKVTNRRKVEIFKIASQIMQRLSLKTVLFQQCLSYWGLGGTKEQQYSHGWWLLLSTCLSEWSCARHWMPQLLMMKATVLYSCHWYLCGWEVNCNALQLFTLRALLKQTILFSANRHKV